jgi:2-haloacid dehalogenase
VLAETRPPTVLAFDVFGTVVDWHGTISREFEQLKLTTAIGQQQPALSGSQFALAWRNGYQPAMQRVRSGDLGWTKIDDLHRMILDRILADFGITALTPAQKRHLNTVWHRLEPWPDTVAGLTRLKQKFTICTLSNGNLGLLTNMAKNAGLPWDLILSAEVFRHYKPDPQTYLGVCEVFDIAPAQMMLVAAHKDDLDAAQACGCQTAFIERPDEFGPVGNPNLGREARFSVHAENFLDLADQLGAAGAVNQ